MGTKEIGNLGEKIAENYLRRKGYQILDKNYSFRIQSSPQKGEIDIIAKKENIITFIEVKTLHQEIPRSWDFLTEVFSPEKRVDFFKQRKLIKTATAWLMKKKIPLDVKWQIDVVAIKLDLESKKAKIRHFQNAVF